MRVLKVHNYYRQAGGEDVVAAIERALLMDHGHEVRLWSVSNDAIKGVWRNFQVAWQAPYSPGAKARLTCVIAAFGPDVVHVHNFFPILTPSIYDACNDAGVPVVQTLHNYRLICPQAMLLRNGKPCDKCVSGSPYHAVLYGCYRGSRLVSLVPARMVSANRRRGTWRDKVSSYIALTRFAKEKLVQGGLPADKIAVKPNFVADPAAKREPDAVRREGALFVGRLSAEKGIATLLQAWRDMAVPLRIIGDGPSAGSVERCDNAAVEALGRKTQPEVIKEMRRAAFLIMPSQWYEAFPVVIVEAFATALPIIASRLGAMSELIDDGVTGLHFTARDAADLAVKVRWAVEHPDEMRVMGVNARRVYEQKYTPEANYRQLMAIYEEAIEENNCSQEN